MWPGGKRTAKRAQDDMLEEARGRGGISGNAIATIVSLLALIFSGYSFYESVLKAPALAIYVPPNIDYTDPDRPDSPFEVFIIPVTLTNDGARTGTILSIDLEVTNPRTGKSKMFYAAQTGTWGVEPRKPFAPVSLPGKGSFSAPVQFFSRRGETIPRILDFEAGDYRFKLTLNTAVTGGVEFLPTPKVRPLYFARQIGKLDYRNFNGSGTMEMWNETYRSSGSVATKKAE